MIVIIQAVLKKKGVELKLARTALYAVFLFMVACVSTNHCIYFPFC